MLNSQDKLEILRALSQKSSKSQRQISKTSGFSLGKVNYCLKALKGKGLIKIKNFKKSENKNSYIYLLTPKGIIQKGKLTYNFMKKKMKEYDELKAEIDKDYDNK
jgi:EPS-associated MarR family transcriptional regulator